MNLFNREPLLVYEVTDRLKCGGGGGEIAKLMWVGGWYTKR